MISYAQNFEDVMLFRLFGNRTEGFYIDIGAMDPTLHSVTKAFTELGFDGVNIEPSPGYFDKLSTSRPHQINLNVAIDATEGERTLYVFANEGISTFDPLIRNHFEQKGYSSIPHVVKTRTLASICDEVTRGRQIDFLKIDVEGWEATVLGSADFTRYRPVVVLVESIHPTSAIDTWSSWEDQLLTHDYEYVYADGLNRFYLRRESASLRHHFSFPPNVRDEFEIASVAALISERDREYQEKISITEKLCELHATRESERTEYTARLRQLESAVADLSPYEQMYEARGEQMRQCVARVAELEAAYTKCEATLEAAITTSEAEWSQFTDKCGVLEARVAELVGQLEKSKQVTDMLGAEVSQTKARAESDRLWFGRCAQEAVDARNEVKSLQRIVAEAEANASSARQEASSLYERLAKVWQEKESIRRALETR